MFKTNKYSHCYYNIITRAKSRSINDYTESHHILPKSLGGTNDPENLVNLTAREHYICHLLLTKFTEGIAYQKMSYALHRITNKKENYIKSSRMYEIIRKAHSKMLSEKTKGVSMMERCGVPYAHEISDYQKQKIRESNSKRIWTDDMRQKMSKSQKQRKIERPETFRSYNRTDEHKQAARNRAKAQAARYTFDHLEHGRFHGTTGDLAAAYQFSKTSEAYKLAKGIYKTYKGWKLVS